MLFVLLSSPISKFTFGTDGFSGPVALLCLAILFRLVTDGQRALIQGMRRIGDMAIMNVLGAIFGTIASIALVLMLGEKGLVRACRGRSGWSLCFLVVQPTVGSGLASYVRCGSTPRVWITAEAWPRLHGQWDPHDGRLICRPDHCSSAGWTRGGGAVPGCVGNRWTLCRIYSSSNGGGLYPRLVGAANEHPKCNRLVEQAHVGLVLAGPGVVATLTLAPWILSLLYSSKFSGAIEILRWICLGIALRVITWPIGYIIVAKNKQVIFLAAEVAWTIVNVALTWWLVGIFGLNGAGIAFFLSYVFHGFMIYPIVRRLSGFRWSGESRRSAGIFIGSIMSSSHCTMCCRPLRR